ncbi:MAG: putative porin [Salinimicrobium sp.]
MKQLLSILFFLSFTTFTFAQNRPQPRQNQSGQQGPQERNKKENPEPAPVSLYKIISVQNDTTHVDTTLNIYKDYRFNYLRQDNFGLLPFPNVGQTYNRLKYEFSEDEHLLPQFGARARHYAFMEADDVDYYHVPTPFTELYFKTVFQQGQTLDALFSMNTSPNLNFSLAYKGLRSLGIYRHMLVSSGNFRTTVSYNTPNGRYHLKTHFAAQDLLSEENGGLTDSALDQYLAKNPEFDDRSRLDVKFEDAQSTLFGKRFFLKHSYDLVKSADSLSKRQFSVGHLLNFSDKKFVFEQQTANEVFGPSFEKQEIFDRAYLEDIYNELFVQLANPVLGDLTIKGGFDHFDYHYNSVLVLEDGIIPSQLSGDVFSVGGSYRNRVGRFGLRAEAMLNITGPYDGYDLEGELTGLIGEDLLASVGLDLHNRAPNFNFLLHQSDYINYNWQTAFSNQNTQSLIFKLISDKWVDVKAEYTRVGNYAYFGLNDEGFVQPMQFDGDVNYLKVMGQKELSYGRFALNNTVLFQKVLDGQSFLHVPELVTRNTFYYRDHWFKRALYLQTGFTFNYFTNYYMDAYDPVLAEFYVQNDEEIDGIPGVDFFFNGKIRQARIFFKLQRVDALINGNKGLTAPMYPSRDFAIRFGLVWNFFM